MKTLYVRLDPRKEAKRFYRCGIEFGQDWKPVRDLDDATAQRLAEEQMLEVTETCPAELEGEAQAGDSAETIVPPADNPVPPADAPAADDLASALTADETVLAAGAAAAESVAEVAAPEAVAEVAAPAPVPKKKAAK